MSFPKESVQEVNHLAYLLHDQSAKADATITQQAPVRMSYDPFNQQYNNGSIRQAPAKTGEDYLYDVIPREFWNKAEVPLSIATLFPLGIEGAVGRIVSKADDILRSKWVNAGSEVAFGNPTRTERLVTKILDKRYRSPSLPEYIPNNDLEISGDELRGLWEQDMREAAEAASFQHDVDDFYGLNEARAEAEDNIAIFRGDAEDAIANHQSTTSNYSYENNLIHKDAATGVFDEIKNKFPSSQGFAYVDMRNPNSKFSLGLSNESDGLTARIGMSDDPAGAFIKYNYDPQDNIVSNFGYFSGSTNDRGGAALIARHIADGSIFPPKAIINLVNESLSADSFSLLNRFIKKAKASPEQYSVNNKLTEWTRFNNNDKYSKLSKIMDRYYRSPIESADPSEMMEYAANVNKEVGDEVLKLKRVPETEHLIPYYRVPWSVRKLFNYGGATAGLGALENYMNDK